MTFKKTEGQTMPSFTEKERMVMERVKAINNPETIGSIAELGNIGYLVANLENIIGNWQGLDEGEIHLFEVLSEYNKKSEHAEFELSNAFINSDTEEEYKELEPNIYFYCGKVVDPKGKRGFISEDDVESYLELSQKSPENLESKKAFVSELKSGGFRF